MPPRTRACAICRKKRIKCDATLPECLMCIRTGKQCPGPLDGPLIVDMTASASKSRKRSPPTGLAMQIAAGPSFTEAFYANFLNYFTSTGERTELQNRQTWLHQLPFLSSDGTNEALTLALKATASAYCGMESQNPSIVQDSVKTYGQALSAHSKLLRRGMGGGRGEVTVHMVSTSVMLSLFEAIRSTTAEAYREHIYGAARMLEVTGPGQCLHGVLCQLFFHIRTQMAFVYLTSKRPDDKEKRLEVRKILQDTLRYERMPTFQRLMTYVATLAEIYVNKTSHDTKEQMIDISVYARVRADVEGLWLEYQESAAKRDEQLYWQDSSGKNVFRDGFTALSIAYFSTARMLFTILAPRLAATYIDLTDHYALILDCARYLKTFNIGCAYMRMATPLFLVALHAPKEEQKREARIIFEGWKGGTMGGVSALALEAIAKRQDEAIIDLTQQEGEGTMLGFEDIPLMRSEFEEFIGGVSTATGQGCDADHYCNDNVAAGIFRLSCEYAGPQRRQPYMTGVDPELGPMLDGQMAGGR